MQASGLYLANTICDQLAGSAAVLRQMIGARDIAALPEDDNQRGGIQFGWPSRAGQWNKVVIKLEWNDTYTVTFYEIRKSQVRRQADPLDDVYADSLTALFQEETDLSLTPPHFIGRTI
jgi:hypothetical protein